MPVLTQNTQIERIYLPMTADLKPDDPTKAWVDIIVGPLTAGDIRGIDGGGQDAISVSYVMIANRIKNWNMTDAEGKMRPITAEWVAALPPEDYQIMAEKVTAYSAMTSEEKKT